MNTIRRVLIFLGALLALAIPLSAMGAESGEATIEGWVEVWQESDEGEVLSVYLDDGETWYVVEATEEGSRLTALVGRQVRATGAVADDPDDPSVKRLTVRSFELLDEDLPDEEPYEEPEPSEAR